MSATEAIEAVSPRSPSITSKRFVSGLLWGAVLAVFAVWMFTLRPQSLGGPAGYILVRGVSMNPTYHTGDLVLVRKVPSYSPGDIVAYRVPQKEIGAGVILIHRLIGGSPTEGFDIQGDNNPEPDPWHPKYSDIVGKAWIIVPRGGFLLLFLHSPLPLASLAAGIAVAYFLVPEEPKKSAPEPIAEKDAWVMTSFNLPPLPASRPGIDERSPPTLDPDPRWMIPHPDDSPPSGER